MYFPQREGEKGISLPPFYIFKKVYILTTTLLQIAKNIDVTRVLSVVVKCSSKSYYYTFSLWLLRNSLNGLKRS